MRFHEFQELHVPKSINVPWDEMTKAGWVPVREEIDALPRIHFFFKFVETPEGWAMHIYPYPWFWIANHVNGKEGEAEGIRQVFENLGLSEKTVLLPEPVIEISNLPVPRWADNCYDEYQFSFYNFLSEVQEQENDFLKALGEFHANIEQYYYKPAKPRDEEEDDDDETEEES